MSQHDLCCWPSAASALSLCIEEEEQLRLLTAAFEHHEPDAHQHEEDTTKGMIKDAHVEEEEAEAKEEREIKDEQEKEVEESEITKKETEGVDKMETASMAEASREIHNVSSCASKIMCYNSDRSPDLTLFCS